MKTAITFKEASGRVLQEKVNQWLTENPEAKPYKTTLAVIEDGRHMLALGYSKSGGHDAKRRSRVQCMPTSAETCTIHDWLISAGKDIVDHDISSKLIIFLYREGTV